MSDALIRAEAVTRAYRTGEVVVDALKEIDLVVERGEFTAIAGPSGSGKSTLLNLIGGLDNPTSGRVFLAGHLIGDMSGNELSDFRRDHIGFVFQSYNLIPQLDLLENILVPILYQDDPDLEIEGVLLTMFDGRLRLSNQVAAEVRRYFGDRVFEAVVQRNVRISEAPSFGKPVLLYDAISSGSRNYMAVAAEVVRNNQRYLQQAPEAADGTPLDDAPALRVPTPAPRVTAPAPQSSSGVIQTAGRL